MNEIASFLREARKMSIGLERLLDLNPSQMLTTNFPPYDILRVGDSEYVVSFAVAGYSEDDLEITVKEGNLIVKGGLTQRDQSFDDARYVHKGIATRTFTKVIPLAANSVVKEANLEHGILSIIVTVNLPEENGVRIPIGKSKSEPKRQTLLETADSTEDAAKSE